MDKYVWRLLTAMFLLMVAAVLAVFVFLFQGEAVMVGICLYGALICALCGIAKGLFVIIDYHREYQKESEE